MEISVGLNQYYYIFNLSVSLEGHFIEALQRIYFGFVWSF